jgi:hypothetical protein
LIVGTGLIQAGISVNAGFFLLKREIFRKGTGHRARR